MTVLDDTVKGTTMGDPDGPTRFEESLDCEVPTFLDPRKDLIPSGRGFGSHKRLDYHVPFAMRGEFRPEQWPKTFRNKIGPSLRTTADGFVLCTAFSKRNNGPCGNKAVNRTVFCRNHGGALHPADKKLSGQTLAPMPEDRIENLDRVQKFMQGFLSVEELDDDEITNSFVRTSAGVPIKSIVLGKVFEQRIAKELHARLNRYLMSKTPRALEVLYEILDSELVEPADRLKAIQMLTDRTMGKPADVLIHAQTEDKPYESIISRIQGGSREEYRNSVASARLPIGESDQRSGVHSDGGRVSEILDAEEVDPDEPDDELEGSSSADDEEDFSYEGLPDRREGDSGNASVDLSESGGDQKYDSGFLADSAAKRQKAIEARERIKKARARRFAKRAVGGINDTGDTAFLLEFIVISDPKSKNIGKYRMKIHTPDKITESLLARVQANNTRDLLDVMAAPPAVDWDSRPLDYHNGQGSDQEK